MYSEHEIHAPILGHYYLSVTQEEKDKLINNWKGKIKNSVLTLEMSHQAWTEKQKEDRKNFVNNVKDRLKEANPDYKTIIQDLLDNIYA